MHAQKATKPPSLTIPAPDFDLYGLAGRPGVLDDVSVLARKGVDHTYGVWLAHLTDTGGVRVGTFRTDMTDDIAAQGRYALLDLTIPTDEQDLRPIKTVTRNARPTWTDVRWTVNGTPKRAQIWRFAGAWAGWTVMGDLGIVVVSTDDVQVDLRRVDGRDFGIQPGVPIGRDLHRGRDQNLARTRLPMPNRRWHADQLALIG